MFTLERHAGHAVIESRNAKGLDVVRDRPHGKIALKVETHVVGYFIDSDFPVAILNDVAGLHIGERESLALKLDALGFDELAVEDRVFIELDDAPVCLDSSGSDIIDASLAETWNLDGGVLLTAQIGKDLDANVVA
jgi:hypothetical protein